MAPETVIARVMDLDPRTVSDGTSSTSVDHWDSLGHVMLLIELEATYGVSFSVEESLLMKDCATIKHVLADKGVRW
jgi:acyl carrier protein